MRGVIAAAIVAMAAMGGYLVWLSGGSEAGLSAPHAAGPAPVTVVPAATTAFSDRIEALGTTQARESVVVTPTVVERVAALNIDDGAYAERGEVLAVLEHAEERASLEAAKARLLERQTALARAEDLATRNLSSRSQLDELEAAVASARAEVDEFAAQIEDRIIRAPFSGRLGLRMVSAGSLVTPGERLTTIDDLSEINIDFTLAARFLPALATGQRVVAAIDALGAEFEGTIAAIDPRVDPVTRAARVRAVFANPDERILPGLLARIAIQSAAREAIVVPESALMVRGEETAVYVVEGGRAQWRRVETGGRRPGEVEIVAGLAPGEQVVADGQIHLRPGQPVAPSTGAAKGGS